MTSRIALLLALSLPSTALADSWDVAPTRFRLQPETLVDEGGERGLLRTPLLIVRDEWYQTPSRNEPQAIVKVRMTYHRNEGVTRRQFTRIDGHPIVQEPNRAQNAIAIPVGAGAHKLHLYTAPVSEVEHRHTDEDGDTHVYYTRHLDAGCGQQFVLRVEPDATYRLELDYDGAGYCEVTCQREVGPGQLTACEGFVVDS